MADTAMSDTAKPKRRRWPWVLGVIAIAVVLVLATLSSFLQWTVKRSWPQTEGTIAVVGLSDIIVVDTPDAILVTNRDNAQNVKKVVDALKARARPEVETHTARDTRWGRIEALTRNRGFSLDLLTVEPGATAMINGTGIAPSLVTFLSPGGFYERHGHRIEARAGACIEVESDVVLPVTNATRSELRLMKLTLATDPPPTAATIDAAPALPAPHPATT